MKAISEHIYERGKHATKYVRRRIPAALRSAYPSHQTHIVQSLGTSDLREAKARAHAELARIDAEFTSKRQKLDLSCASMAAKRVSKLSDEQLRSAGRFWSQQVLLTDEKRREQCLDDEEFDELGEQLTKQRVELGRLLAQGKTQDIYPAMHGFLYLCGLDFNPEGEDAKRACYIFLRAVVETLDHQLARQRGEIVDTAKVVPAAEHPLCTVAPERAPGNANGATWDSVFEKWRDHVDNRPKSTTIAAQTPWRDLRRFAAAHNTMSPDAVTPRLMTDFAQSMRDRELAVDTINERISKIRAIYKIAVGRHLLDVNPAADTLGFKENSAQRRRKRRLPFDEGDLSTIFGSEIYTAHKRSRGQSGEASYWIPLMMFYTGARPEELCGLALSDLRQHSDDGWYFELLDRPTNEDHDLFDEEVPASHRRTLKNGASQRRVPVAKELIELGLLRYVEHLRARKETVLFPTLAKDWHGKLGGAFSKFFGRELRALGITDSRKVLYSFRHTMKDMLEKAGFKTKYLQRFLGHTSGDGVVTDGYGSDLPFDLMLEQFKRVRFPAIPALPWEPGRGATSQRRKTK
ncbi:integrase [Hydrogenophaga borbori]|uniref:Integrase n=1 Tax=Hydrogenophaga borbori TaxID=2294117 RepID=A0A372EFX1_9BURK|nr:site-specific integrase [Hydrogenophaga borbori]RFP77245.1 integrase [Hydrogenophaga borbori]